MKLILISVLIYSAICSNAQIKDPADTLVLTPLSRLQFCMSEIEQVSILKDRLAGKDKLIELANQHAQKQEEEKYIWKNQFLSAEKQDSISRAKYKISGELLADSEAKTRSLRRQNTSLKIGLIILIGGIIYEGAHK